MKKSYVYIIIPLIIISILSFYQINELWIQGESVFIDSNNIEQPIEGATIYFEQYDKEVLSDSLGFFLLENITSSDTTNLVIRKDGYITKKISKFPIAFMQERTYKFILIKQIILK